jgi:DNA-binding transcriptional ArsR family regulator
MTSEKDNLFHIKRLSSDSEYFNNVFKKTEKLVSVIFYILSHINKGQNSSTHLDHIKDKALQTHELSLETLRLQGHEVHEGLETFLHSLVALESTLRLAEAAGAVPSSITGMLFEQLDGTQRFINHHYLKTSGLSLEGIIGKEVSTLPDRKSYSTATARTKMTRRQRVSIPAGDISSDAHFVYSQLTDRADRIKTVLEAKPNATIKDISEIITDVSEKTIQRELNSLIDKGQVIREGERRWSKYSVKK